jgi:CheY-like chemotaxis protein
VRLNAHGYEVITAVDGEDALRRARELEPDLVLLDIMMPRLDGISVLKELKRDTALAFIPVILVTAKADTRDIGAGTLFVPIAQPRSKLVMSILEPLAPDSLAGWGDFNNAFERKEYMEDYVAEEVARDMLARDPSLKSRFERRLREDPAFAADKAARLDFFYRLHSAWDERYNLYPVMRIDHLPR